VRTLAVFLIILLLLFVGIIVWMKILGNRAATPEHVDVKRLDAQEIARIGTRSAGFLGSRTKAGGKADRLVSRAPLRKTADGLVAWDVRSDAGVMTFQIEPGPDGRGLRVVGAAGEQRLAVRNSSADGIWGLSSAITDGLARMLGIPHNPGRLLRQRQRVLAAIARADAEAAGRR
jgi:hypothetical protein